MIKYYYRHEESDIVKALDDYQEGAWIYVEAPDEQEIQLLINTYNIEEGLITDALDEDEMPRIEREADNDYMFARYAYTTDELQIVTAPVMFAVNDKFFLTVSAHPLPRMDRILEGKVDIDTTKSTRTLLQVLDQIVDHYEVKINNISRQIKSIRSRLRVEEIRNKDFIDFVGIEDMLNEFLSALTPTNSILQRMLLGKHLTLNEEDEDLVEDLRLNNEQSIEACKSNLKTIVNIREAYSTIMSNNLNRVIRLLTVLTVVLAVPTLISSVFGMNVPVPFQDSEFSFAGIMAVSLIIAALLLVIFRNRNWL